jgi:hypothetical protein
MAEPWWERARLRVYCRYCGHLFIRGKPEWTACLACTLGTRGWEDGPIMHAERDAFVERTLEVFRGSFEPPEDELAERRADTPPERQVSFDFDDVLGLADHLGVGPAQGWCGCERPVFVAGEAHDGLSVCRRCGGRECA